MTIERRQLIESLFESAIKLQPGVRASFLEEACANDASLRREMELMLRLDQEAQHFLESPAIEQPFKTELGGAPVAQAAEYATPDKDLTGRHIGTYQVVGRIGDGGMGIVYRARDEQLDRTVAIKVLRSGLVADPDRRRQFMREARAASAVNHPNIITIHAVVEEAETVCMVMELVVGRTLASAIPRTGMPLNEVLRIAIEIADAFAAAHEAGLIHRDLKPANIMLTEEGRVKVLDFGLAKLVRSDESDPVAADTSRPCDGVTARRESTERGVILGTAAYMSPEQVEGGKLDARSDIFSLGTVLYEMITGRRPFEGPSRKSILTGILHGNPETPRDIRDSVPVKLDNVVLRCLEKDVARRYQTMGQVKMALEEVRDQSSAIRSLPAGSRPAWVWRAAALMVPLAAGILVWRQGQTMRYVEPMKALALTTSPGVKRNPSFSPDGGRVVFTWDGPKQDNPDIYVQTIGARSLAHLTADPHNDFTPAWSPDGGWIAFLREMSPGNSELRLIRPSGGPERLLAEVRYSSFPNPPSVCWCPDNECVIVTDSTGEGMPDALFRVSVAGGEKTQLTHPPRLASDIHPAVSPDGRLLAFRRHKGVWTGELYRLPLGKGVTPIGEPQRLTVGLRADHPTWMPDSREILFSAQGGLWRVPVSGERAPARLPFVGQDGLMPVVSRPRPGGLPQLIYVRSFEDSNIWRIGTPAPGAPAPSAPVIAISSTRRDVNPSLSPDGRRVVFDSNRSGSTEVWLADLDGSNAIQLTSLGAVSGFGKWSPDGRLIAFHSNVEDEWHAYVVPASGGKPDRLPGSGWPVFSHDGRWVYLNSNAAGRGDMWKMPMSSGDAIRVTRNGAVAGMESVDGKYFYYRQTPEGRGPLWRIPAVGGQPLRLLDGMYDFFVIEQGIYYVDQQTEESNLRFLSFASRKSTLVARNLGKVRRGLTASADGRMILYARVDSSADDLMIVENFR